MKKYLKTIIIFIIIFLFLNLLSGLIFGFTGMTSIGILEGFGFFALYGLIFGIIYIFVDKLLAKYGK